MYTSIQLAFAACIAAQATFLSTWRLDEAHVVVRGAGLEFSGVCPLPSGGVLTVDDRGELTEWNASGARVRSATLPRQPDVEDITRDPRDGSLWLVVEDTAELWRVRETDLGVDGRWRAPSEVPRGPKGVEAIAFVPREGEGFEVWLGHQGTKAIFVVSAPTDTPSDLTFVRRIELGDEARAFAFDARTHTVLAACQDDGLLVRLALDGQRLEQRTFSMAPHTIEGLALAADGALWACADGGDAVRFALADGATAPRAAGPKLVTRATIDVPSFAPEIVAVHFERSLLLATDASSKTLEMFRVLAWADAPQIEAIDLDKERDGVQRPTFENEPTSVAIHRSLEVAFVTEIGASAERRGRVHAIDLRAKHLGARLWSTNVGRHPDNCAVSPDGRWLVVANEGEGEASSETSPGTISVFALEAFDPFASDASARLVHVELDPSAVLGVAAGVIEPEYVAFDPLSRFAVVTCQENDAAVIVDLRGARPMLMEHAIRLPRGAQPDGLAVFADYVDAELGLGVLIAFAEEGDEQVDGQWPVQALSLAWLNIDSQAPRSVALGRVDLVKLLGIKNERAHPESVVLLRHGERMLCAIGVERADAVLLFDVTDARSPRHLSTARVGRRPEGLCMVRDGPRTWFVTGDEGKDGPGEISFVELVDETSDARPRDR